MRLSARLLLAAVPILAGLALFGCPMAPPPGPAAGSGSDGNVSDDALSFEGTAGGTVAGTSSTTTSGDTQAARRLNLNPLTAQDITNAVGWFEDLGGGRLLDANGDPYPNFVLNANGTFSFGNLPVGVDIVIRVDLDGDGQPDITTIINIPRDEGEAEQGTLNGVKCDPLSTLAFAKFQLILAGIDIQSDEIDFSAAGLIERIRDAFEHLFEDSGIDTDITIDQIRGLTLEQLATLFERLVPLAAQRGMLMAEHNIALAVADDVQGVVLAAAKILLQGGFVIADDPGGIDLSVLGELPNVRVITFDEFFDSAGNDAAAADPNVALNLPEPTLYVSEVAEVDRNFAFTDEQRGRDGPMFSEHVLKRMAQMFLDGKTVSLSDLHQVVVDVTKGMGARLIYPSFNFEGPYTEIFETADGTGIELNLQDLFMQLEQLGAFSPDPDNFEEIKVTMRNILVEFLAGTVGPSFERLFAGILMDRVPDPNTLAGIIRDQRAHLPFSRSGPSRWFVIATADSALGGASGDPVSVIIDHNHRGVPETVTYDATGNGDFYLGFGPMTPNGMEVHFVSRTNGRFLHDYEGGFVMLDMADRTIFQDIGGQSFFSRFSETVTDYPGAPALRIPNPHFDPALPPDPETNPPDKEVYVLMNVPGPDGVPVRVDYADGVATYNAAGMYYLMFDDRSDAGSFTLISESGVFVETTPGDFSTRVMVDATAIQGTTLAPQTFTHVFGIEVANGGYDPTGAPYYDDINGNGQQDSNEPSFDERQFLFDPNDWRSTWVEKFYRRGDNNGFPDPMEIAWDSPTPKMNDGTPLVARNFRPRLNAFRFGRPNVTVNLLMAFSPPEFFDGTHALNANTRINPFTAIAFLNLVFDSIHNVVAVVDYDGAGPAAAQERLIDAHLFVAPIGDPVQLIIDGLESFGSIE